MRQFLGSRFQKKAFVLVLFLASLGADPVLATESYPFPGKAVDMKAGEAWYVSHDHAAGIQGLGYDMSAVRWSEDAQRWTRVYKSSEDYEMDPQNDDWVIYGKPIYAIADGFVTRCWRNAPENPRPGESHWGRLTDPPKVGGGGNGLWVQQDDGAVTLYAHMQPGTIPESLCPVTKVYVDDADVDPVLSAPLPRVMRGMFLGRVGNSGASSNPHLHIHLQNIQGQGNSSNSLPLDFHNVWVQATDDSETLGELLEEWTPLTGGRVESPPTAIYPSPFLRKHDAQAGTVYDVAIEGVTNVGTVTAVQDADGNLKLITWGVDETGKIVRKYDESAGYATHIQMAHPGYTRDVVTALKDGGGNLKLISWEIYQSGAIGRRGEASAGPVSRIAMTQTPTGGIGVVTVVRDSQGDLKLITWGVDNTHSQIDRIDDASAGAVSELSITRVVDGRSAAEEGSQPDRFTGVVTAVKDGEGKLKLIAWEMTPSMQLIRRGEASAGVVALVSATTVRLSNLREMVVTAVRQADGKLKVIAWEIDSNGQIVRKGDASAGLIYGLQISQFGNRNVVTAVRQADGTLRLIAWYVNPDGTIERDGENDAGSVYNMAITGRRIIGNRNYLIGAFQTGDGNFKTISWEVNVRP